jgi:hypothetical protein
VYSTIRYQSTYTKSFKVSLYAALAPKIILPLVALEVEEIVTSPETEAPPKIKGVVMLVVNTGESMELRLCFQTLK